MNKLEAMRAKLAENQNNKDNKTKSKSGGDNASFPFWNMKPGESAVVRFLPDADETNDFFWRLREVIKLPFEGVVGGDYPTDKRVEVTVPCIDMFGKKCPLIAATKYLWDKEETKPLARTYWKKRSYIFQGFVLNSSLEEENVPENPIRRFVMGPQIYQRIYEQIMDPDLTDMPTEFDGGRDFTIKVTKQGEHNNYSSSAFKMNPRSLTEVERSNVDRFKLFDLKEALGAEPTGDALEAMKAMLKDSLDGQPFDMESYGQYYRPYTNRGAGGAAPAAGGNSGGNTGGSRPVADDSAPFAASAPAAGGDDDAKAKALRVLANLRANMPGNG